MIKNKYILRIRYKRNC